MEIKQFKCRASQVGKIMTNDRSGKFMGETAKSYLEEWLISEITCKKKEIKSKYLERGNAMESAAIYRASKHFRCHLDKNEVQLEDEYFTGTFDAKNDFIVIDTKVTFDCFTFPFFETEINKDYYAQLQIYMELTGLKKAALCYCLENGSAEQIEKLSWQITKEKVKDEPDIEEWEEAEKLLNYDHLPEKLRIKVFEFEYNHAFIDKAKTRILECRAYINLLLNNLIK